MAGIGGHHSTHAQTHDWITPKHILTALGNFDIDPCASVTQPWPCAARSFNVHDDGLSKRWQKRERAYVNQPYGKFSLPFMERLAEHGNGIGLLFGRTETGMFMQHIWKQADAILFLYGRLTFHRPDGSKAKGNSGGPSVLIAYGDNNVKALKNCGLPGAFVTQWDCLEGEDNDATIHL